MYSCRICNEQVVGDDRAVCMHMRTHDIQISMNSSTKKYDHEMVKGDNVQQHHKSSNEGDREHLTNSLVLLSNGSLKPFTLLIKAGSHASVDGIKTKQAVLEKPLLEQSMPAISKQGGKGLVVVEEEDEAEEGKDNDNEVVRGTFECRACNKVFYSHQALGGHRASHKKIKGCFAAAYLSPNEKRAHYPESLGPTKTNSKSTTVRGSLSTGMMTPSKKKPKSHECSICHRVFPSGQALGGHKRCHWLPSSYSSSVPMSSSDTTSFYSVKIGRAHV